MQADGSCLEPGKIDRRTKRLREQRTAAMTRVWRESKASGAALVALLALAERVDTEHGDTYPPMEDLAARCRSTEAAVRSALAQLERAGEVTFSERYGYCITLLQQVREGVAA